MKTNIIKQKPVDEPREYTVELDKCKRIKNTELKQETNFTDNNSAQNQPPVPFVNLKKA